MRTTPSYLTVNEDGTEYVAVASKRIAIQNINSTFYGTKFFFGRKFSDEFTQKIIKRFPFKVTKGPNDEVFFLTDKNVHHTPKTATIHYLTYVRDQAEALTGKPVKKVVMSVPHFISDVGRTEIKETVKECGMDVVKFMEEPIATAFAYNIDKNEKVNKFIVFNFGGLSFSLANLEKVITETSTETKADEEVKTEEKDPNKAFEIKSEYSDFFLGGEDIDVAVTKYLLNEFERINKMDISSDLFALQRLREAAEKAKIELSLSQQAEISLAFLAANETGPKHLNMRISRSKFETLIDPIVTKLKQNCEEFLKVNNIKKEEIDEILLVGGVSRIPRVQEIIKQVFGKEPNKTQNPEEAPACGASMIASQVKLKIDEIKQMDNLPLSIGIETLGGNFIRIVNKGTPLPAKITKAFTTVYDNQPRIDLKFYLGEREIAAENKLVGSVAMNIPLLKKGEARINVTFNMTNKGDLAITAVEDLSKKSTSKMNIFIFSLFC